MDSACAEAAQELMRVQITQLMVCISNTVICATTLDTFVQFGVALEKKDRLSV